MAKLCLVFKKLPICVLKQLYHFTFPIAINESSYFSTTLPAFDVSILGCGQSNSDAIQMFIIIQCLLFPHIMELQSDMGIPSQTKFPISFMVRFVIRPITVQWMVGRSDVCYFESRDHKIRCVPILCDSFAGIRKGNYMRTMP